jgi:hypothetical protein
VIEEATRASWIQFMHYKRFLDRENGMNWGANPQANLCKFTYEHLLSLAGAPNGHCANSVGSNAACGVGDSGIPSSSETGSTRGNIDSRAAGRSSACRSGVPSLMDGGGQDELGLLSDSSEDPSQRSSRRHFSGKVDSASVEDVPIGGAASPDDSAGARATASTMDGSVHWSSETHAEDLHNIGTTAAVGANNPWGRDRDSRCHPTDGVNIVEERVNS